VSRRPGALLLATASGALGALTALTACSGASSSGAAVGTASAPASAPVSASAPASAPASVSEQTSAAPSAPAPASSTAPPSVRPCDAAALRLTAGRVDAGAGQRYVAVILTNTTTVACTVRGYPGVAALDAAGRQVTQARRVAGPSATVQLEPGGTASAVVHATAVPSGTATACPADYPALLVTPPDTRTSQRVAVTLPSCGGLDVRPLVPGTTGV